MRAKSTVRLFYLNNIKYFNNEIIRTHALEFKLVSNKTKETKAEHIKNTKVP